MDMPWNPAVLEQRIGRVHRMGQRRSVQVLNFVAQGSIEESMLQVLSFKKSLFAGVLDGGPGDAFMQGTRLSRFMENVESVTSAIASAEASPVAEDGELIESAQAVRASEPAAAADPLVPGVPEATQPPAADPWAPWWMRAWR